MMLDEREEIESILDTSEWQTFDCKRARIKPSDICQTICAFANTEGGVVALGVEDPDKAPRDKRLIGISEGEDNISDILNLIKKNFIPPLLKIDVSFIDITNCEGHTDQIILLRIPKSNEIHSLVSGDTYRRDGRKNHKMTAPEITALRYEKGALKFEDEYATLATLEDLDLKLIHQLMHETSSSATNEYQFLKDNGLAEQNANGWLLYKSAVLLFGKNPSVQLKGKCGVKISHYYGKERNYSGRPNFVSRPFTIEGPLITQIKQAVMYYKKITKDSPPILKGATFVPSILIPEWVFQEAVTNAVIHRNYHQEDDIQVRIFDDRIEVESPGVYPGHITPFNIRQERYARNPMIQRTLNRFESSPNLDIGEGVDRMFEIMQENNLYEPLYSQAKNKPHSVQVILYNMQRLDYWDTVKNFLQKKASISNKEAREITGIKDTAKVSRLFAKWVKSGLLEKIQDGYNGNTRYKQPGDPDIVDITNR